jgi:UDP-glucose 4-epimerase
MATQAKSSTILITGGLGYIGSHTLVELIESIYQNKLTVPEATYKVLIVDDLSNSTDAKIPRLNKILKDSLQVETESFFDYEKISVIDVPALEDLFQRRIDAGAPISHILHFAALKAVGESMHIPLQYFDTNVVGTINLLKCMEKFDCKNFIFSSSATVYGNNPSCKEEDLTMFASPYGCTKLVVDNILKATASVKKDWSCISLRYFNPCGAHASGLIGEFPTSFPNNLFPYIEELAIGKREILSIFGSDYNTKDGTGVRDYIHVADLAKAHICAVNKLKDIQGYEVYNIGTGTGYSVLDILKAYSKACGRDLPYKLADRRAGDIDVSLCCPDKATRELGWKAERGLEDMCNDSYRWRSQNVNGFI